MHADLKKVGEDILFLLRESPTPLKAIAIAVQLQSNLGYDDVTIQEVNTVLFGPFGELVQRDSDYAWTAVPPVIFVDKFENDSNDIEHLGEYHPYWLKWKEIPNPGFGPFSSNVLSFKNSNPEAIETFRQILDPILAKDIAIAAVPPHNEDVRTPSGVRLLAKELAKNGRIDAATCLVRQKRIRSLAMGGRREISIHLGSITVTSPQLIRCRGVLLLDDVTTTGNSLTACRQLLMEAGAARVRCVALGKTVR